MSFQKATRSQRKLRMLIAGPSGSGKTYSALSVASGLGQKIAVIDTEHGSSSLYSDGKPFNFDVNVLQDLSIDKGYIRAIREAVALGYDVLIIDSVTHAWEALLEFVDTVNSKSKFNAWGKATPLYKEFLDAILRFPGHVIATSRVKTEYAIENKGGKSVPQRVGTKLVQRDGFEYEFDVVCDIDLDHSLQFVKSRFSEFQGAIVRSPDVELGQRMLAVIQSGAGVDQSQVSMPPSTPTPAAAPTDLHDLAKSNQPKPEFLSASESEDLQRAAQDCYGERWQTRLVELCEAVSKQGDPLRLSSAQCQMLLHGIRQKIDEQSEAGCNTEVA